jgi:ABC-2 type transport system permease protein
MTALLVHFRIQTRAALRSPSQLLMSYLFPLAFYALMGAVMTKVNPTFKANMIPAMTIFAVMTGGLLGLPGPLVEEREKGIYRSYRVNGVPAAAVVGMPAVTVIAHALVASGLIAVTAGPLFGAATPSHWAALALCTALGAVLFAGIGTLVGVVSPDTRFTVLASQAIFLPSMLLGGLMMPYSALPESVRRFALLLPTTWLAQLEQATAYGVHVAIQPWLAAAVLGSATVVAFVVAAVCFQWDRANAGRRGRALLALLVFVPFLVGMAFVR